MIIAILQVRIICSGCGADFNYNTRVDSSQNLHVPFSARFASRTAGWDTESEGDVIRDLCPKCKTKPPSDEEPDADKTAHALGACGGDCPDCQAERAEKREERDEEFNTLARDFAPDLEGT